MEREHLVLVLDTLERLGLEGAAWVVGSATVLFLEDGFSILGGGRVAASITAPDCGWPGQLCVLKFNVVASFALPIFFGSEVGMQEELLSALLANIGKELNCVGQFHVRMTACGLQAVKNECLKVHKNASL